MTYETILYARDDKIVRVTLNRPDKRNSLTEQMLVELDDAFRKADAEEGAACVVLRGAGEKAFCAGADLGGFSGGEGFYAQYESRGLFPKLFLTMERMSKPTIAAVNGACVAGGFGLMMACDLAIAKAGVKVGTPEIARGLFPYMISALMARAVPRRKLFELVLMGELITSEEAATFGVVNRTVPEGEFDGAVEAWARKLAGYSPAVLRLGRRSIVQQEGMPLEGRFAYLQGLLSVNTMMEDAAEGITAFFEKRDPVWKGK